MSKEQLTVLLIVLYIIVHSFIIEPSLIRVTEYEVQSQKLDGIKVVFASDFHLKENEFGRLNKIVNLINKQEPDIVILGGDYAPSKNLEEMMDLDTLARKISLINTKAPIYSVLGEYDWYAGGEEIKDKLKNNGIRVLENENASIKPKGIVVSIVGLADITQGIEVAKASRGSFSSRILVTHNPDIYYNIIESYDLILAGHTHGGQIIIPFTPPLFSSSKYRFDKGIVKSPGRNTMIITSGLGTTGIKARFNCRPEIVVIKFTKNTPKNKK